MKVSKKAIAFIGFGIAYVVYHKLLKGPNLKIEKVDHLNKSITYSVNGERHVFNVNGPRALALGNGYNIVFTMPTDSIVQVNITRNGKAYKTPHLINFNPTV